MNLERQVSGFPIEEAQTVVLQESIGDVPAPSVQVSFPRSDVVVVAVSTSVDRETVDELESMLWPEPASAAGLVIVDLTNMYVLDVPDLQLLTYAHMLTHARGGAVRVVAANRAVRDALHAAGLHVLVECHGSVQEALAPVVAECAPSTN